MRERNEIMEIRVHLTDGKTHVLSAEEKTAGEQIVASIHPARFFLEPSLQFQGSRVAVAFNPRYIEFVEFRTSLRPSIMPGEHVDSPQEAEHLIQTFEPIRLIGSDDYERMRRALTTRLLRGENKSGTGREVNAVAEMSFPSGVTLYMHLKGVLGPGEEKRRVAMRFFDGMALIAVFDGGFTLINPNNGVRFCSSPPPAAVSVHAWRAEPALESAPPRTW
jgi:hypothetical protein